MKKLLLYVMAFVICLSIFSVANAEKYQVTTEVDPINVRLVPRGEVIGTIKKDTIIDGTPISKEWVKIMYDGQEAYLYSQYLTLVDSNTSPNTSRSKTGIEIVEGVFRYIPHDGDLYQVCVEKGSLNVRKGPSMQANIIVRVKNGGYVEVLSIKNGWAKIDYGAKRKGYVKLEFLVPVSNKLK